VSRGILGADACWPAAFRVAAVCFQIELIPLSDAGTDIRGSLRARTQKTGPGPIVTIVITGMGHGNSKLPG
jgi:hypothetical protein